MPPPAYFGIESSGLSLAVDLLILFTVVLWLALVYWAYADARRRIADPALVGLSVLVVLLFPFIGAIVYAIVRPPEYIEDARERELEMQAAEVRLGEAGHLLCPYCDYRIEREFVRCPSCLRKLKERCVNCSRPLDQAWTICPYCEADVPGLSTPRARRRRGALEPELASLEPATAALAEEPPLTGDLDQLGDEVSLAAGESERRAGERRTAAAARAAARASRPRPAP